MSIGTFSMEEYIELFKNPVKVSINKVEDRAMWMAEGIYDNINVVYLVAKERFVTCYQVLIKSG